MLTKYYDHPINRYYNFFDIDKFFSDAFNRREGTTSYAAKTHEDGLTLTVDLPGAKLSDLKVQAEGNFITIEGKRKGADFKHTYTLSKVYDPSSCAAALEDGELTLEFKKREEAKPRLIQIEVK